MKKKPNTLGILMFASLLSLAACNNSGNNSTNNAADSAMAKVDTSAQKIKQGAENVANDVKNAMSSNVDSNFVVKATIANMDELKILQAGLNNGMDKDIKAHAKMMMADHKKLGEKVKEWSAKVGYPLPDNDKGKGDDAVTALDSKTKGADWDKAWTDEMISGHEDAISLFEDNQKSVKDGDLRALITDALPTLHAHLDMMKKLKDKLNNNSSTASK